MISVITICAFTHGKNNLEVCFTIILVDIVLQGGYNTMYVAMAFACSVLLVLVVCCNVDIWRLAISLFD